MVDYVCTFHDNLSNCSHFKVNLVTDLMCLLGLQHNKFPDHSVIEFCFTPNSVNTTQVHNLYVSPEPANNQTFNVMSNNTAVNRYLNANNGRKLPVNFLEAESAEQALFNCINSIQMSLPNQTAIDNVYDEFCNLYYNEIRKYFKNNSRHSASKKQFKNSTKPFWNINLTNLWKGMKAAEIDYLKTPKNTSRRQTALRKFKEKRNLFDKSYSKTKRKYQRDKMIEIENLNTKNPKEFWAALKKLGPRQNVTLPLEVYDDDGQVTADLPTVFSKWNSEYENLFKGHNNAYFDAEYLDEVKQSIQTLENNPDINYAINAPITLHEVN